MPLPGGNSSHDPFSDDLGFLLALVECILRELVVQGVVKINGKPFCVFGWYGRRGDNNCRRRNLSRLCRQQGLSYFLCLRLRREIFGLSVELLQRYVCYGQLLKRPSLFVGHVLVSP